MEVGMVLDMVLDMVLGSMGLVRKAMGKVGSKDRDHSSSQLT